MQINPLSPQFSTTAQISVEDIANIARQGYKTIVNFRPDDEGGDAQPKSAELAAEAKKLGLEYFHIPVIPNQIQAEQVNQLAAVMGNQPQPILGFCRTGNRAAQVYQQALSLNSGQEVSCAAPKTAGCKMIAWFKSKCLITRLMKHLRKT